MMLLKSILTTVEFELARMMTPQRGLLAAVMVLFPPLMTWILTSVGLVPFAELVISIFCGMTCLLSLLLWATPNVYAELEGKSWTFVTSRPWGRWSILFGKYLIAAGWSFAVSWIALSLCMLVVDPEQMYTLNTQAMIGSEMTVQEMTAQEMIGQGKTGQEMTVPEVTGQGMTGQEVTGDNDQRRLTRLELWMYLSLLLLLASMVYAAVFSFLGVISQRRAMVIAVGYFLVVELILFFVPAVVGKLAMTYHLLCLLFHWIGWILPEDHEFGLQTFQLMYGVYPVWMHLLAIATMTAVMLGAAAVIIRRREYITLEDAQT